MKVHYLGNKDKGIHVTLPVHARNLGKIKERVHIPRGGSVDLEDSEAKALIELDSHNFGLEPGSQAAAVEQAPVKRRGRPKKNA